jgi:hypothetical protein
MKTILVLMIKGMWKDTRSQHQFSLTHARLRPLGYIQPKNWLSFVTVKRCVRASPITTYRNCLGHVFLSFRLAKIENISF